MRVKYCLFELLPLHMKYKLHNQLLISEVFKITL